MKYKPIKVETDETIGLPAFIYDPDKVSWIKDDPTPFSVDALDANIICPNFMPPDNKYHLECPICEGKGDGPNPVNKIKENIIHRNKTIVKNLWNQTYPEPEPTEPEYNGIKINTNYKPLYLHANKKLTFITKATTGAFDLAGIADPANWDVPIVFECPEDRTNAIDPNFPHYQCPICEGLGTHKKGIASHYDPTHNHSKESRQNRNQIILNNLHKRHFKKETEPKLSAVDPTNPFSFPFPIFNSEPTQKDLDDLEEVIENQKEKEMQSNTTPNAQSCSKCGYKELHAPRTKTNKLGMQRLTQQCPNCNYLHKYKHPSLNIPKPPTPIRKRIKRAALLSGASFTAGHYFWDNVAEYLGALFTLVMQVL